MNEVDPEILRTAMRGYETAGEFIEIELRARLSDLTFDGSLAIFKSLFASWQQTGAQAGGDMVVLDRLRIEEAVDLRSRLNAFSARRNLHERSL